ncbi:MAG: hypothetical protein SGBAC_009485 [Bacillariaceae sp.]
MAPTTIAINQEVPAEVSPMREPEFGEHNRELYEKYCHQEKSIQNLRSKYKEAKSRLDRMRTEGSAQKKMILDMNDIVEALRNISVYNDNAAAANAANGEPEQEQTQKQEGLDQIAKKIQTIDKQLKTSMLHTVQLDEIKKIANSTISDQEEQIKALEDQLTLMEARMQHSETHRDIMLPDTSYETQLSSMQKTITNLTSKIKGYELQRDHNGIAPQIIDLTNAEEHSDPPGSATASITTEGVSSHPSDPTSAADDYRMAQLRIEELESTNKKITEDLQESITKMTDVTESATALQTDLRAMEKSLAEQTEENEHLTQDKRALEERNEKLESEVAQADIVKKDFEELERTVIAKVEELEHDNSLLQEGQEKSATKIMDLTAALEEAENAKTKLASENHKLSLENAENTKLLEQLSSEATENGQAKRDFEELERIVIARVEELEKENKALKEENNKATATSLPESTSRSIDIPKSLVQVPTEENDKEDSTEQEEAQQKELEEKLSLINKLEQQNKDYMDDVRVLAEENSDLKVEARELEEKNGHLNNLVTELQDKIFEVKENASLLEQEVSEVREVAKDLDKKYSEAKKTVEETQKDLEKTKEEATSQEELQEDLKKSKEIVEELKNKSAETAASFQELEDENRRLTAAMNDLAEENDRLEDQHRASVVVDHPWDKKEPSKTDKLALESENEKLREENDENLVRIATLTNSLDDKDSQIIELQNAMDLMNSLEEENNKLMAHQGQHDDKSKADMPSAEEAQKLRKDYEDMQRKLKFVNKNLKELQSQHARLLDDSAGSQAVSSAASTNGSTTGSQHSVRDIRAFDKLKSMHQAVAMKLADLGEENATLNDQLDATRAKVVRQQETIAVLHTIKEDYSTLMDEYHHTVEKLNAKEDSMFSLVRLQQEHADACAKITVLQWENDDLSRSREMYNHAEARIGTLERQVMEANESFSAEKRKSADHMNDTQEVIAAYKELEAEHQEVSEKMKMLQALMEGEESAEEGGNQSSQAVQKQRNAAWKQVRVLEEQVVSERKNTATATEARIAREGDLKLVLAEYESIQLQYEKIFKRVDSLKGKNSELKSKNRDLKAKNHHLVQRQQAMKAQRELVEIPEEKPIEIIVLDDEGEQDGAAMAKKKATKAQEDFIGNETDDDDDDEDEDTPARVSNELVAIWQNFGISKKNRKQSGNRAAGSTIPATATRRNSANSCGGGDQQSVISRISTHLEMQQEAAENEHVQALEERHDQAVAKLERMEGELLLAQREAEDAKKTQVSKEIKLRDTSAKLFKLEREHQDLQGVVMNLRSQLGQSKKESGSAEAEVKGMRKLLVDRNLEYKELQAKHDSFIQKFSEADVSKMEEMVNENQNMNAYCKEYLTTLSGLKSQPSASEEDA